MEDFILEEFIEVDNKNSIEDLDKKIKINETKIKRYKEKKKKRKRKEKPNQQKEQKIKNKKATPRKVQLVDFDKKNRDILNFKGKPVRSKPILKKCYRVYSTTQNNKKEAVKRDLSPLKMDYGIKTKNLNNVKKRSQSHSTLETYKKENKSENR